MIYLIDLFVDFTRLGKLEDATACFSNALKMDCFFVNALLGRGNTLMDHNNPEMNNLARYAINSMYLIN